MTWLIGTGRRPLRLLAVCSVLLLTAFADGCDGSNVYVGVGVGYCCGPGYYPPAYYPPVYGRPWGY